MQQMQLDPLHSAFADILRGFTHHVLRFAWKPKDHVNYSLYPDLLKTPHCVVVNLKRIATSYIGRCFRVNGLQAKLDPYGIFFVEFRQKIYDIIPEAIGARGDGKSYNIRLVYCLHVQAA